MKIELLILFACKNDPCLFGNSGRKTSLSGDDPCQYLGKFSSIFFFILGSHLYLNGIMHVVLLLKT